MKFTKPSLSLGDQIALLERRGMAVPDRAHAQRCLQHISYYRLRAYWLPFEEEAPEEGDHKFKDGTTFDDALTLYVFDRQLRLHVMDGIERIEVALRSGWAYCLANKYGPHGYIDPTLYDKPEHYAKALTSLLKEIARSTDTFMVHYKKKYDDPEMPPIWMTSEVMSLGQLSKWYGNLKLRQDRQAISKPYGLDEKMLVSIAHHLTYIRNICAHHGRLWNKQFTVTMTVPTYPAALSLAVNPNTVRRLYNTLATINYLMGIIAPGSQWRKGLIELIDGCPLADNKSMGFPDDWKAKPAWRVV